MKLSLALLSLATADIMPSFGSSGLEPSAAAGNCPKITCVMFCANGMQKNARGCDICSCARVAGQGVASTTGSCTRDANGCCSELGVAWCPDQNSCVSTKNAVIPCKSWGNNIPATPSRPTVLTAGSVSPAPPSAPVQTFTPVQSTAQSGLVGTASFSAPGTINNGNALNIASGATLNTRLASSAPLTTFNTLPINANAGLGVSSTIGLPDSTSCSQVMCAMFCPNGMLKDARGCDVCACAGATPNACPSTADCAARSCPGGYSKDSRGCPTCICLGGSASVVITTNAPVIAEQRTASATVDTKLKADALVAVDRPSISLNPCLPAPGPCKKTQRCVPSPKQCFTTPCPQYTCVPRAKKAKGTA